MLGGDAILEALLRELMRSGVDPEAWALAWARLLPAALIVPAFGLRGLAIPGKLLIALALASGIAPALSPVEVRAGTWQLELLRQLLLGLPIAVGAAVPLWAATMAGNAMEALRLHTWRSASAIEDRATPLGTLLSLGACAAFLRLGGPASIASALAAPPASLELGSLQMALGLVQGIRVAVLLAAPLLCVGIVLDTAQGVATRTLSATALGPALASIRSLVLLGVTALLLNRLLEALVAWMLSRLR